MICSDLDNLYCLYPWRHTYSRSEFQICDESETNIHARLAASAVVNSEFKNNPTSLWDKLGGNEQIAGYIIFKAQRRDFTWCFDYQTKPPLEIKGSNCMFQRKNRSPSPIHHHYLWSSHGASGLGSPLWFKRPFPDVGSSIMVRIRGTFCLKERGYVRYCPRDWGKIEILNETTKMY